LVNSRPSPFTAAPQRSSCKMRHVEGHPFFRSYGANLPSSLTRVLSRTLGFSPCLPVSVYGTGTVQLPRGFSWQHGISHFATIMAAPHHLSGLMTGGFSYLSPYGFGRALPITRMTCPPASPHQYSVKQWGRNIDRLSIAYDFRPRLRPA
jgi:hypothetical protein